MSNEVTVKQAAADFGFKVAKPFIDLGKKHYPLLANNWKASTKIPVEMVRKLKEKAEEFEDLAQLIDSENSNLEEGLDEEAHSLESGQQKEQPLAIASGSPYEGLSCRSSADALSMVRRCSTALEYAFTSFSELDFLYLYEAATTQAITEYKVYKSVKAQVSQQLAEADTKDKLEALHNQSANLQETVEKLMVEMGVKPIEETLGNAQRSEQERTEQVKKRVSELATVVQLSCNPPL